MQSRRSRAAHAFHHAAIGLLLAFGLAGPVRAQGDAFAHYLDCTPKEQEAFQALSQHKLVRLRELARAIINANPQSVPGHFLMGYSLHHSEGDLPRARFHLEKADDIFTRQYGAHPMLGTPWGWEEKVLMEMESVSGEMDLYSEQIRILEQYEGLIRDVLHRSPPVLTAAFAWPLMKLGKETEARSKLAAVSIYPDDEACRTTYWNTKGALEMETDHAQASYDAFKTLIDEMHERGWPMACTYLRNAGEAAACVGRFDEAERLYLESTDFFDPQSFSNPWWDLANLYLSQARFPEALSALKKTHKWTYDSEQFLAQQSWAANQQLTCELLLQLGMTKHALEIAETFINRPDRKGGDSVQRDQWEAANLLIYREALLARRASLQEELCWAKGWHWWELLWEQRQLASEAYLAGERAAAIAVSHGRLARSLRYSYAPGTVIVPNYYRPALVAIYGAGACAAALQELESKKNDTLQLEMPYFQTIEAEVSARTGDRAEALKQLDQALAKLPAAEKLLRARCEARAGQLEEQQGEMAKAMTRYTRVMQDAPGIMRILEIALPVSIQGDSNGTLRHVARMLRSSPRFREDSDGLIIQLSTDGSKLTGVLSGRDGSVLAQAEAAVSKDLDQSARDLVADIHWKFFAPNLDLSQLDINSLDGSNLTGKAQSDKLKEMFMPGSEGPRT